MVVNIFVSAALTVMICAIVRKYSPLPIAPGVIPGYIILLGFMVWVILLSFFDKIGV